MKLKYLVLLLTFSLFACESDKPTRPIRTGIYFDLVALLDQQANHLSTQKVKLVKRLEVNSEIENITMTLDSISQWKEQFALFYQADINKLGLEKAYQTEELLPNENRRIIIDQAISPKVLVRLIEYNYVDDQLENIRILIRDENTAYEFDKELNLNFKRFGDIDQITSFSIVGNQDMILKSALNYSVKAEIEFRL
jgi:hypothetical protein